jgi:CMP-N-acetylneuraminic acid synthetase
MKIYALLTGRGNNTLQDKNILEISGKPVLYYPAHAARNSYLISDWYCSSDDEKILSAAEKEGYKRITRPVELALPTSQHVDTIIHALNVMAEKDNMPDICVVLLANNVTVKSQWITECIEMMLLDSSATAAVPVYIDNDHHPLRAKIINQNGTLEAYDKTINGKTSTNRQDLPSCFFLSHNFWVLRVSYLLSGKQGQPPWGFMGDKILPYRINESIDIHDLIDLHIAREWIGKNYSD